MFTSSEAKEMDYKMLSLIEQQLDEELILHKKYLNYGQMCFDSELKNACFNASHQHKENYNRLLTYLQG